MASCVLAASFTLTIVSHGIPALRHDWFWPSESLSRDQVFLTMADGWRGQGIGGVNPFVNNYLFAALLVPLQALFGAYGALVLFWFAIAMAIVTAARRLALTFGAADVAAIVIAACSLCNPWTYSQVVAGHGALLVAFAATMLLVSEMARPAPSAALCACAVAGTLPQLQFFMPALPAVVALGLARRLWLPLATWIVVGAATFLGVLFSAQTLISTPVTTAWEQSQSIAPIQAVMLSGYFARYADAFDVVGRFGVAAMLVAVIVGCAVAIRSRQLAPTLAALLIALVVAMGVKGPFGGAFAGVVERAPALGLYRELYDIIGYVVIGYAIFAAVAAARYGWTAIILAVAALLLGVAWVVNPPTHFWADRRALPTIPIVARPQTRIALSPAFQPLQYEGRYSGLDPDAYARAGDVGVLNSAVARWPEDVALATYLRDGDTAPLAGLSVSQIAQRDWYSTPSRELGEQLALPLGIAGHARQGSYVTAIAATPLLSLIRVPPLVSVSNTIGAGSIFFGDIAGLRGEGVPLAWSTMTRPEPVNPPRRFVHAGEGWVDTRLAFATNPELGQPFGGALTTSSSAVLAVKGGTSALVFVRGELRALDGRSIAATTGGYRWVRVPGGVDAVSCHGLCVVALRGDPPSGIPENVAPPPAVPVVMRPRAAWFIEAQLPPGPRQALRYNVRYDDHWICLGCPARTLHLPLDATVNGWLLPPRDTATMIRLVEWVALVQAVAQAVGLVWMAFLLSLLFRSARVGGLAPRRAA